MSRSGNNLVISQRGVADIITVTNFFIDVANRIEYLQFDDGTKFNLSNVISSDSESYSYSVNGHSTGREDNALKIKLLNSDDKTTDYSSIINLSNPLNGSVSQDENGEIIYTPNSNFNGEDSFTISYLDSFGIEVSKNITVDILAVNDSPTTSNLGLTLNEDEALEIFALASASDIDVGDILSISSVANPAHGSARIVDGKILSYILFPMIKVAAIPKQFH